jgi:hypothetical protein
MYYQHYLQCPKGLAAGCMTNYYVSLHFSVMGFMSVEDKCIAWQNCLTGTKFCIISSHQKVSKHEALPQVLTYRYNK